MEKVKGWSVETLHEGYGQMLQETEVLYDSETEHQRLRVFTNPQFGRVLTLDGVVQTTEADEFIYHEMLTHVPILAHGAATRVLIIGGGDGGMAREVLRHKAVEHVTMVEIDAGVVEFAKQYLPSLSAGAFDDARLNLVIADGAEFVAESQDRFDVIIIDSTDPIGPGEVLFTDTGADQHHARLPRAVCGRHLLSGQRADLCRRADGLRLGHGRHGTAGGPADARGALCRQRDHNALLHARLASRRLRPTRICPETDHRAEIISAR